MSKATELTFTELITELTTRANKSLSKKRQLVDAQSYQLVNALRDVIIDATKEGKTVSIPRLFKTRFIASDAHSAHRVTDGTPVEVPAKIRVRIDPRSKLIESVEALTASVDYQSFKQSLSKKVNEKTESEDKAKDAE